MAKTVIGLEVNVDSKQAEQSVGSFKKQLRDATAELVTMSEKFGVTSTQAANAAKKVAGLKDAIGDAKALAETFNPDKKFVALGGAVQGVAAGFSAFSGVMGLLGSKSEETEKILLKVQSAMALQQGISGIMAAKDSFELLKGGAVKAFQAIKTAIGSTGIGLIVIALGAIYTYWDDIKAAVSGVSEEQKQLNKLTDDNLAKEQKKLDAIGSQDNVLKLQGKSEKEILQLKVKQIDAVIEATKQQINNGAITTKVQVEAAERNHKFLKGFLDFLILPIKYLYEAGAKAINGLIGLINKIPGVDIEARVNGELIDQGTTWAANLLFDPEQVKKDAAETEQAQRDSLAKLQNDRAGFLLNMRSMNKAAKEEDLGTVGAGRTDKIENNIEKNEDAQLSAREKRLADFIAKKAVIVGNGHNAEITAELTRAQTILENERILGEQRKQLAQDSANALTALSDIVGKETAAGKAMAVAAALINTYQGISKGVAMGMPWGLPSVISAAATGFAAVKNILKTKVPGKSDTGGGSSVPSVGSIVAPLTPQAQTTTLDQNSINAVGNAASRAYVLESDVSGNQDRVRRLNRAARIN